VAGLKGAQDHPGNPIRRGAIFASTISLPAYKVCKQYRTGGWLILNHEFRAVQEAEFSGRLDCQEGRARQSSEPLERRYVCASSSRQVRPQSSRGVLRGTPREELEAQGKGRWVGIMGVKGFTGESVPRVKKNQMGWRLRETAGKLQKRCLRTG
jgi:hypothetical protein